MAEFNFVVDTNPMASSVDGVSNHITATTAAVVAMQTAVIASEQQSAKKICANVDKGFYNLIRSQVTMKLSGCFTEMQAKLALLNEYSKTLQKTQGRMESDYYRVKAQYQHIIKGLDKALANRISQLDKAAVSMAEVRKKVTSGMFERHVPETVVTSSEVDSSELRIASSRLKDKTNHSLDTLANKVSENQVYKSLMDTMLDKTSSEVRQEEYVPVVYASKQSTLVTDTYVFSLHYPEYLPETIRNSISLNILNQEEICANGQKDDFERKTISDEFQALVASSRLDERVAQNMMRLFQQGGC
ncbi:MAG: hypothetical protein ACI4WS_11525 [Oscillospiraceae bacterium]